MDNKWFTMEDVRRRNLGDATWIPLRASQRVKESGERGYSGYISEFFGLGSLAVPLRAKQQAEELEWIDIGLAVTPRVSFERGKYYPSDTYRGSGFTGLHLALAQPGNDEENSQWHLHQDFVVALGLLREGDTWLRMSEGYVEVARLARSRGGEPCLIEVRSSHLKDYLCARRMGLYTSSYRDRVAIVDSTGGMEFCDAPFTESIRDQHVEAYITEVHEGGRPFGRETHVFNLGRTDVDPEVDVPVMGPPNDDNVRSESWIVKAKGRKLFQVRGEMWRSEWIDPAPKSPLVRRDKMASTIHYIVDAQGTQETGDALVDAGRWLWFRPEVMPHIAHRRGGSLAWYTRDTGRVACSPGCGVVFGVNSLGLVNVYAKDIALLPEWQQKIWHGHNLGPEGKVSEELLASQVQAQPADTQAPEPFVALGIEELAGLFKAKVGIDAIWRVPAQLREILERTHRFRAIDKQGLFALAKDLARLTAENLNAKAIQTKLPTPKGTTWGSLKSLENLLATHIHPLDAYAIIGPLVGIYELRHADAHLPRAENDESFALIGIDQHKPFVVQGYELLNACVTSIYSVCDVLKGEYRGSGFPV